VRYLEGVRHHRVNMEPMSYIALGVHKGKMTCRGTHYTKHDLEVSVLCFVCMKSTEDNADKEYSYHPLKIITYKSIKMSH